MKNKLKLRQNFFISHISINVLKTFRRTYITAHQCVLFAFHLIAFPTTYYFKNQNTAIALKSWVLLSSFDHHCIWPTESPLTYKVVKKRVWCSNQDIQNTFWSAWVLGLALPSILISCNMHSAMQKVMAQTVGSLMLNQEIWMEFLALSFSMAQTLPLQISGD